MTIDEAIVHCEEKAKAIWQTNEEMPHDCKLSKDLCECAKEHEQLAEWLKELKDLRHTVSLLKFNIHALNELVKEINNETDN